MSKPNLNHARKKIYVYIYTALTGLVIVSLWICINIYTWPKSALKDDQALWPNWTSIDRDTDMMQLKLKQIGEYLTHKTEKTEAQAAQPKRIVNNPQNLSEAEITNLEAEVFPKQKNEESQ